MGPISSKQHRPLPVEGDVSVKILIYVPGGGRGAVGVLAIAPEKQIVLPFLVRSVFL